MQVFLGDRVTLIKKDTWITGQVSGVVLDDTKEIHRVYIHNIDMAFYVSDGWRFQDEDSAEWK